MLPAGYATFALAGVQGREAYRALAGALAAVRALAAARAIAPAARLVPVIIASNLSEGVYKPQATADCWCTYGKQTMHAPGSTEFEQLSPVTQLFPQ